MILKLFYRFFLISCFYSLSGYTQDNIPIGSWRTHLSFNRINDLIEADNKIYASTRNAIFYFDQIDNSLNKITPLDGLSDVFIRAIGYNESVGAVLIGYENGNIDLIMDNRIINFPVIKESGIIGSRRINHFNSSGDLVYISTDFGIVVFDIEENEIRESYLDLGENGSRTKIFKSVIRNDSLFLGTEHGVFAGSLNGINLQDFNNWKRFNAGDNIPDSEVPSLTVTENNILALVDKDGIYSFNGRWSRLNVLQNKNYRSITSSSGKNLVTTDSAVYELQNGSVNQLGNELIVSPDKAIEDQAGRIWIGDRRFGLIVKTIAGYERRIPSGPFSDKNHKIRFMDNRIYVLPGGYDENFNALKNNDGFYAHSSAEWTNFNDSDPGVAQSIPPVLDITDLVYENQNKHFYFSSYGFGLIEWDGAGSFNIFDESNSPLENVIPGGKGIRITALENYRGEIWLANHGAVNSIHQLKPNGDWESYSFNINASRYPLEIVVSQSGDKWFRLNPLFGGGILVFNELLNQSFYLTTQSGRGGLPDNNINDIEIDLEDQAWIGTDQGVVFFPGASSVLVTEGEIDAITPVFEGRPLLSNQKITAIEVDGGNRKWIGTTNGIWLFDEDGERVILNFTTENSPLLSNVINDIEINEITGEVFIGTDRGIISYRSDATQGTPVHTDVKIFPNPVTRSFTGQVGISGLANNSIVKITDISGKLIFQTRAEGGTATWDVMNYEGERAASGVYLVFSSTSDGSETFVGKIAVVN